MDNVNFQAAQKKLQDSIIKEGVETGNITMIKVVGSSGGIVSFKINKHTPMSRVLDAYAKETGQERHTIRPTFFPQSDVEKPSQCESSPNSTTTPSMDSPRSRNHSPSSLNLKREEEKEKRAAEEQKEAEGRARKLAQEKARTVAAKQAQREKEEKARKPAVEEAQREVKKSKRCMLEERKRVEEQLLEEEETEKQQDDERKKNEAQDLERGRQASSIWGTLVSCYFVLQIFFLREHKSCMMKMTSP
ncbi:uncharacterized protein C8R40DRAFT_1234515 [Lentinula edodes]|uniref:uncharacterized protein n=1 Tax=Lentinula edodes TaxID=5353 RepID=UPI001E8CA790|nr:uncharacterized protein C8R40DRAFT_1234515 [Lentinula edodes]KAH7879231.1 hypothetical protein C8R40DRAFT_1234515 [Lentinula edodes]